ncbi:hypothetical protein Tco_0040878 [Tanacetum coccineum]
MAEQNVPNQPPTRTDEQIVPRSQWLTIGKSNLLFNAQKIQKNPIFQISFWNTMKYNKKIGVYSCQVDEQWFDLSADLLRKALAITPVNPTHPFELPPSGRLLVVTNPSTQFLKCYGESSLKLMADHASFIVRKGKPTFPLVDEDDEAQQESIPQEEGDDPDSRTG